MKKEMISLTTDLVWPRTGYDAEMLSFLQHARIRHEMVNVPCSNLEKSQILFRIIDLMPEADYELPDDFLSLNHFRRVIHSLNRQASPGYPYMLQHMSNESMFGISPLGEIQEDVVKIYYGIVLDRLNEKTNDHIRLFIKQEPITLKKYVAHKERLISSVSVIDQLIDHLLFDSFNNKIVQNWDVLPTKVGWSPLNGGWILVPQSGVVAADKSSWDWTCMGWQIELLMEYIIRHCTNRNKFPLWEELVKFRFEKLFIEPTFILSSGLVFQQKQPGLMKSGSVLTLTGNSVIQYIMHIRICNKLGLDEGIFWSMGDDTLQSKQPKEYFEELSKYCILKQVDPVPEFAGMTFRGSNVEPNYTAKHIYNLLYLDPQIAEDVLRAYYLLYYRSNKKGKITKYLDYLGKKPSEEWLSTIFDGE